mmetsp:Transcript_9901/g.40112  ORF Transcript_9901/g.40112 Transcript_9901/m.40112 type:complete len:93 (-) Transcript_9901:26-304(-)
MNPGRVKVVTRSQRLHQHTAEAEVLARAAANLFISMRILPSDVRGVGLHVDELEKEGTAAGGKGKGKGKGKAVQPRGQTQLTRFFSAKAKPK